MTRVIVVPTAEDQMLVDDGMPPNQHFDRSFDTEAEAKHYDSAANSLYDLVDYRIVTESALSITVRRGSENDTVKFTTAGEKAAYLQGLEDGDGFLGIQSYVEGDLEFEEVAAIIDRTAPTP